MSEQTDTALWQRVVDGDGDAFVELFTRHADAVANYAFRRTAKIRRLPRHRRSRWGVTVALAGALVLLSAVAAVGYGLITPQERFESVGCYDQPSLDGSVSVVSTSERDPVEVCRQLWAEGAVGGSAAPVPASLEACVLPSGGAVGVFPGRGTVCDTWVSRRCATSRSVRVTSRSYGWRTRWAIGCPAWTTSTPSV